MNDSHEERGEGRIRFSEVEQFPIEAMSGSIREQLDRVLKLAKELDIENQELRQNIKHLSLENKIGLSHYYHSPLAQLKLDQAGIIREGNQSAADLLAVSSSTLNEGHIHMTRFLSTEYIRDFQNHLRQVLRAHHVLNCRVVLVGEAGVKRHLLINSLAQKLGGGTSEIYITMTDVSTLKNSEDALLEVKNKNFKLSQIASQTEHLVCITDSHGMIEWVNRSFELTTGFTASDVKGRGILEVLRNMKRQDLDGLSLLEKTIESQESVRLELLTSNRLGFDCWIDLEVQPERDEQEKIFGFMFLGREISRRKAKEQTLQQTKELVIQDREKLKQAMEQAPVGIFVLNLDFRFVRANEVLGDLMGYGERELLHMGWADLLKNREATSLKMLEKLKLGESHTEEGEDCLRRRNHKEIEVALHFGLVHTQDGSPDFIVGMLEDISAKKHEEEERIKLCKLESLGLLAGGIAHDLNNIIMGISVSLEMAIEDCDGDKDTVDSLQDAQSASMRAKDLANRLLTFAKGGEPIKQPEHINECLENAVRFALRGSNLKPRFYIDQDLPIVDIDKNQVMQVIENVVINARDASPQGGVLEVRAMMEDIIEDPVLKVGTYVRIDIHDYGEGISKEVLGKIFDPYFTTKTNGNGLGLATCYSIMQRHSGCIKASSENGAGSTFTLYFPKGRSNPVTPEPFQPPQKIGGSGRILLIDDEKTILKLMTRALTSLGYMVESCHDGNDGAVLCREGLEHGRPFDLILLDATIPGGCGGVQALKVLKEVDQSVKIILCSGYAADNLMVDWKKTGFQGVLKKPFSIAELSKLVGSVVGNKKAPN